METLNATPSFMSTCINFFGLKDGQTKMEFGKEFIKLSDADKDEIFAGFQKLSIDCLPPVKKS